MRTRIIEYRGKTHADCDKCHQMVEMDPKDFALGLPCPVMREAPPRPGVDEEAASIPCGGTLNIVPIAKIWNHNRYDFTRHSEILGIPCDGRRVQVVEDVDPDDNNISFFNDLVKSKANNDWFWAEDIEQVLQDRDIVGAIQRNPEILLGFIKQYRSEVLELLGLNVADGAKRGPGRPPKET